MAVAAIPPQDQARSTLPCRAAARKAEESIAPTAVEWTLYIHR